MHAKLRGVFTEKPMIDEEDKFYKNLNQIRGDNKNKNVSQKTCWRESSK